LSIPLIAGAFEMTLGSKLTSQAQQATLMHQAIITSFILAFCGFSIQAQVASILAQTDIDFKPFFFSRFLHGIFAALYTNLLWIPVYERFYSSEQPANAIPAAFLSEDSWFQKWYLYMADLGPLITILTLSI